MKSAYDVHLDQRWRFNFVIVPYVFGLLVIIYSHEALPSTNGLDAVFGIGGFILCLLSMCTSLLYWWCEALEASAHVGAAILSFFAELILTLWIISRVQQLTHTVALIYSACLLALLLFHFIRLLTRSRANLPSARLVE